ncbi:MAG: hypothetical protein CL524_01135 [Aequorivita sp.]|nr:hypothetical protein [Aequorivita sp.]
MVVKRTRAGEYVATTGKGSVFTIIDKRSIGGGWNVYPHEVNASGEYAKPTFASDAGSTYKEAKEIVKLYESHE